MLTHINRLLGLLFLIVCVSCASQSERAGEATGQSAKVTPATFLNASPSTYVWVARVKNQDGRYVLVYSGDREKGVVLDVEKEPRTDAVEVRNIGYGTVAGNGWNLYNKGKNGLIYESQGGEWTLRNFSMLLTQGLKQKQERIPFKQVDQFISEF